MTASRLSDLIALVQNKRIMLCSHWDADGVSSAALIYHTIKPHAKEIHTKTKGMPFLIEKGDINKYAEVIICTDIAPSNELFLLNKPIAYIDHHPDTVSKEQFTFLLYDETAQSTSSLIYEMLVKEKTNPYNIFLALIGYFGDCGKLKEMPKELLKNATAIMPEMLNSCYGSKNGNSSYLEISRFVSLINVGKRAHWSGDVPLELLKNIDSHIPILYALHPIVHELRAHQAGLREQYDMEIKKEDLGEIEHAFVNSDKNVQGVLASRHLKNKPLLIINTYKNTAIGSLRVPEQIDFDAGKFLSGFNGRIISFVGGGHTKAGGFTMDMNGLDNFIALLKKQIK